MEFDDDTRLEGEIGRDEPPSEEEDGRDDSPLEGDFGRDDAERRRQIASWAEYVRTHPDEEWGRQVNALIESHLEHARARQFERPDLAHLRDPAEEDNDVRRPPIAREESDDEGTTDDGAGDERMSDDDGAADGDTTDGDTHDDPNGTETG